MKENLNKTQQPVADGPENLSLSIEIYRLPVYNREWLIRQGENQPELLLFYGHQVTTAVSETCFSQWYPCRFMVDDMEYITAEQFMMAEKARLSGDEEIRAEILRTADPRRCKQLGRKVRNFSPAVWNEHKKEIVYKGNVEKFQQNEELEAFLMATGNKVLVEASPTDRIWGIGLGKHHADALSPSKWRGENLLGFTLMKVRDFIRMDEEI